MEDQKLPNGGALHVDIRVASLHSNPIGEMAQPMPPYPNNEYYGFTYYHDIQIESANGDQTNQFPLLFPYETLMESPAPKPKKYGPFQQTILAFTDVLTEDARRENPALWGYTQNEINCFWKDETSENSMPKNTAFPLFFMSMLNIRHSGDLQQVLALIEECFQDTAHLAYLTFDHCDILLFARGNSFQWQAERIFKLLFSTKYPLRDSITLYCFNPVRELLVRQTEKFDAYIKIGVRDYERAKKLQIRLQGPDGDKDPDLRFGWLLGRNDVALSKRNATLAWLLNLKDEADGLNQQAELDRNGETLPSWYTTYELSVLIPESRGFTALSSEMDAPSRDCGIDDLLNSFERIYKTGCGRISTKVDKVWLRWLRDAAMLSNKLLNDTMTTDLGVCLIPQFLDLLEYASAVFASEKLTISDMDGVQYCFSTFFNNISSLIESTNHSNREFIQVPPFHSVSFEMPPKVMAYYQACGHRLISVLHDDEETYGFTISPKFVQELDVTSLALRDVTGGRQFLSISVGEKSLYTLHHTTMALAHEISHFVGKESRLRSVRKKHLVVCCLQTFLEDMLERFSRQLRDRTPSPWGQGLPTPTMTWNSFRFCAEKLYQILQTCDPQWNPEVNNYKFHVERLLTTLPAAIQGNPEALKYVRDFLYEGIFCNDVEDSRTDSVTRGEQLGYLYTQLAQSIYLSPKLSGQRTVLQKSTEGVRIDVFQERLYDELSQLLTVDIQENRWNSQPSGTGTDNWVTVKRRQRSEHYCYLFSETYADLQAILLLELTKEQYLDQQFLPDTFAGDITLRKLAVTAALVEEGYWNNWEKPKEDHLYNLIKQSVERSPHAFVSKGISPCLFYGLREYLRKCYRSMSTNYSGGKGIELKNLRNTFKALEDNRSVYKLERSLIQFIGDYADTLPNRAREVYEVLKKIEVSLDVEANMFLGESSHLKSYRNI